MLTIFSTQRVWKPKHAKQGYKQTPKFCSVLHTFCAVWITDVFTGPNPRLCVHCSSAQQSCRAELIPLQLRKWCALNPFSHEKLGYHHFSHENCHNDTPGPPCPSPASWPVKEGSHLPKSTSIYKCYICIRIIYIYIYIYTNTHVCFPKRIEGDSWLYIMLEYCHSGFPRYVMIYMMIYVYHISNVIDLSWCLSHRLISTASLARFEAKSSASSNLTTNGRVSSPVVYRSTGPPAYLPTYLSFYIDR